MNNGFTWIYYSFKQHQFVHKSRTIICKGKLTSWLLVIVVAKQAFVYAVWCMIKWPKLHRRCVAKVYSFIFRDFQGCSSTQFLWSAEYWPMHPPISYLEYLWGICLSQLSHQVSVLMSSPRFNASYDLPEAPVSERPNAGFLLNSQGATVLHLLRMRAYRYFII